MSQLVENKERVIPESQRCTYLFADGRQCKNRRWREQEFCYHHDPNAGELRKAETPEARASALRILTATEVQELLARTLEQLQAGKVPVGRAYAIGYLAQLLLGNLEAVSKEYSTADLAWDRHNELIRRVRALDFGTYEAEEAQEPKEAKEASEAKEAEEEDEAKDRLR